MIPPLEGSSFKLDFSGVVGFLGGEEAISAMTTVNIFHGRKWTGWYNSPGSYILARRFGQLANSTFWNGLFPGPNLDPATFMGMNGKSGPEYRGRYSGTRMGDTGHTGHLFWKRIMSEERKPIEGRNTKSCSVGVVRLGDVCLRGEVSLRRERTVAFSAAPIAASIGATVACGYYNDWYSFSMLVLGTIANGLACFVIGSGKLRFISPLPSHGAPLGSGVFSKDGNFVVVDGSEEMVNCITKGEFSVTFRSRGGIGIVCMILQAQFLLQILLMPQGSLFGQVIFLSSLAFSWMYNSILSSMDGEELQCDILMKKVLMKPEVKVYEFPNLTSAVTFVAVLMGSGEVDIIPNNTPVWRRWKEATTRHVKMIQEGQNPPEKISFNSAGIERKEDRDMLSNLIGDAEIGCRAAAEGDLQEV